MESPLPLDRLVIAEKYQLVREIGRGASGAVYEARNLATLGRCSVKVLSTQFIGNEPSAIRRFLAEARTASAVTSANVVRVFDCGVDASTSIPYIVMELLEGEDLAQTIQRLGPIDPLAASKIALQAAGGLAKAHSMGIVHRDIKPANLFLARDDTGQIIVKLCDFGIAKINPELMMQTTLTRSGSLLGTPLYMSPEQAKHSAAIDARTDVWSLGIVMYEMLTGEAPYPEPMSLGELMVHLLTSTLPRVEGRATWVSPELAEIVNRALRRDVTERYRDGAAMRDALAAVVTGGAYLSVDDVIKAPNSEPSRLSIELDQTLPSEGISSSSTTTIKDLALAPRGGTSWRAVALLAIGAATVGGVLALRSWFAEAHPDPPTLGSLSSAAQAVQAPPPRALPEVAQPPVQAPAASVARPSLGAGSRVAGAAVTASKGTPKPVVAAAPTPSAQAAPEPATFDYQLDSKQYLDAGR